MENEIESEDFVEDEYCFLPLRYFEKPGVFFTIFERFIDCILPTILMLIFFRKIKKKFDLQLQNNNAVTQSMQRKIQALKTLKYLLIVYVITILWRQ